MEIVKLFLTPDEDLYDKTIEDVFDEEVFSSTFWLYWRTMFAFEDVYKRQPVRRAAPVCLWLCLAAALHHRLCGRHADRQILRRRGISLSLIHILAIPFDRRQGDRCRGISRMESLDIVLENSTRTYTPEEKLQFAEEKNHAYRACLLYTSSCPTGENSPAWASKRASM